MVLANVPRCSRPFWGKHAYFTRFTRCKCIDIHIIPFKLGISRIVKLKPSIEVAQISETFQGVCCERSLDEENQHTGETVDGKNPAPVDR